MALPHRSDEHVRHVTGDSANRQSLSDPADALFTQLFTTIDLAQPACRTDLASTPATSASIRRYGIISRDGTLSASRRSACSPRSVTQSSTFAAFSPVRVRDALGPGSGAQSAFLCGEASFRGDCRRAHSRGGPVDHCRSARCWLAPRNGRRGLFRHRPLCSIRTIRRTAAHRPTQRSWLSYRRRA